MLAKAAPRKIAVANPLTPLDQHQRRRQYQKPITVNITHQAR
jgi:hypothetical protein